MQIEDVRFTDVIAERHDQGRDRDDDIPIIMEVMALLFFISEVIKLTQIIPPADSHWRTTLAWRHHPPVG
jgi:hypothetical protein